MPTICKALGSVPSTTKSRHSGIHLSSTVRRMRKKDHDLNVSHALQEPVTEPYKQNPVSQNKSSIFTTLLARCPTVGKEVSSYLIKI